MRFGRHRLPATPSAGQARPIEPTLRSISPRISSSTACSQSDGEKVLNLLCAHSLRRVSVTFRRIHPGDVQSDFRTYTPLTAQSVPIFNVKLVRSVVLPPLSMARTNQSHPLRTPTDTGPARDHIISQLDKPRLPGVRPYPRLSPPGSFLELTSCDPPHSHQPIVKPGHRQPFRSHIPLPCSV